MRIFISLELQSQFIKRLLKLQKFLQKKRLAVRLVRPKNLHLTLLFFGDISLENLVKLQSILSEACLSLYSLKLKTNALSAFPNPKYARTIIVKLNLDQHLNSFVKKISENCLKSNILFDDKPFNAHITLARLYKSIDIKRTLRNIKFTCDEFEVLKIKLMDSKLDKRGSGYRTVKEWQLKNQK